MSCWKHGGHACLSRVGRRRSASLRNKSLIGAHQDLAPDPSTTTLQHTAPGELWRSPGEHRQAYPGSLAQQYRQLHKKSPSSAPSPPSERAPLRPPTACCNGTWLMPALALLGNKKVLMLCVYRRTTDVHNVPYRKTRARPYTAPPRSATRDSRHGSGLLRRKDRAGQRLVGCRGKGRIGPSHLRPISVFALSAWRSSEASRLIGR